MTRTGIGVVFVAIPGLLASLASAQGNDSLNVDLAECVNLASDAERFACYEARVGEAMAEKSTPAAESSASQREADGNAPRSGNRATTATSRPVAAAPPSAPEIQEIVATVTELRERIPNSYVITLDNGQVWQQVRSKWYPLRVGLDIRIYESGWGSSYRLTALDSGGYISVKQVR